MAQNYVLLETINLTQTATSVTFDNLPSSGYTDLKVVFSARMSNSVNVVDDVGLSINGSTASFTQKRLFGTGAAVVTDAGQPPYNYVSQSPNTSATANTFGNAEFYIPNYLSSSNKSISADSVSENNSATAYAFLGAVLRSVAAPVTSLTLTGISASSNFLADSTFSLYAIAATGTTPVTSPFASGGNIVANDGTYWYHAFLSSGTFTPYKNLTCDYLVVAGGGGGGAYTGSGGGGAGGLRSTVTQTGGNSAGVNLESALSLIKETGYGVTIGAGGSGETGRIQSTRGNNSVFHTITSTAGGRGGGYVQTNLFYPATTGGSGGGGVYTGSYTAGAAGTTNQGFAGGTGSAPGGNDSGGGGGGAGAVGQDAQSGAGGAGGAGVLLSGLATPTTTGVSGYFAGGGGGGRYNTGSGGAGGAGGGGAGSVNNVAATSAIANTGGGGGGSADNNIPSQFNAGNGGSGIVIVRYPMSS